MERVVNYIIANGSREEPITNKQISRALKLSETSIRSHINKARCEGIPICACDKGYFFSNNKWDILDTVRSLNGRVVAVEKAVGGLLNALFVAI